MNRKLTTALGVLLFMAGGDALAAGQWDSRDEARADARSRGADHGDRNERGNRQQESRASQGGWSGSSRGGGDNRGNSRGSGPSGFQGVAVEPRPDTRRQYGGDDSRYNQGNRGNERYGRSDQRGRNDYGRDNRYSDNHRDNRRYDNNSWRNDNHRYDNHRYDNRDRYDRHDRRNDWRHADWRRSWYHGWSGQRYRAPARYYYPRGYNRSYWRVGYNLPLAFLISSYYVDYRPYGLASPPYGCRWLRVDGDLLLVELATGAIVDALYDFYY